MKEARKKGHTLKGVVSDRGRIQTSDECGGIGNGRRGAGSERSRSYKGGMIEIQGMKCVGISDKNSKNYRSDVIHKITHSDPTPFQSF